MPGIAVLAKTDADPCPRVEITIDGLHATTPSTYTVYRVADGQRMAVQGAQNKTVIAADFVVDYAAPLGRLITYTLEVSGPTIPTTLVATATVAATTAWLQDPLAPAQSTALDGNYRGANGVRLADNAIRELGYAMSTKKVPILGAELPVALGGTRQAATGVPLDLYCSTPAAVVKVRNILGGAFPVMLRPLATMSPLPPVSFLAIETVVERQVQRHAGLLTHWPVVVDLVRGPSAAIAVPIYTWGDVQTMWPTWGAVSATGRTYLQMLKDPRP